MADSHTINQAAALITSNSHFTPEEAKEWLKILPLMNDQQLREVIRILGVWGGLNKAPVSKIKPGDFLAAPLPSPGLVDKTEESPHKESASRILSGTAGKDIKTLEDVCKLTPEALRAWGGEGIFTALKPIVKEYGWPVARMEIEQSPLFIAYVDSGRRTLGDSAVADGGGLERHEFEAVADLMQKLSAVI